MPFSTDKRLAGVAVLAATAAFVAACDCTGVDPSSDAAIGDDAGVDGGIHPPSDSGLRDAGGTDAGHDAGPMEVGWTRVEELAPECDIRFALDPAAVVPALEETPCEGVATGCRSLRFRRSPEGIDRVRVLQGRWDSTTNAGYFGWWWVDYGARRHVILANDRGQSVLVWDQVPASDCRTSAVEAGDGRVAIGFSSPSSVIAGPVDRPSELRLVTSFPRSEIPDSVHVQGVPLSEEIIGVNNTGNGQAWRLEWDGSYRSAFTGIGPSSKSITDVHGDALFADEHSFVQSRVWVSDSTGDRVLIQPTGAHAVELVTDGRNLVWEQGYDQLAITTFTRLELWTAPYTTDPAALMPRRLAVLEHNGVTDAHFSGDHVVIASARARVLAYPLDGGSRRAITAPDGFEWGDILFAGPEEVAIVLMQGMAVEVRFYRYDSLPLAD